jgi:hypothetical protein
VSGPIKNTRHERFAQERAKGKSIDKAYALAGFKPNRGNAARLNANEGVRERIATLQAKAAEKTLVTVEGLTSRLLKIAAKGENAKDAPLLSVARASLMDAAKLNGLIIDRSKIGLDLSGATDEELEVLERVLARSAPRP